MTTGPLTDSLRETLAAFEPGRPLTTSEVATDLDLGRRSTYDRLDRLVERGRLETKKVGASARVWWQPIPDDDGSPETAVDAGESAERDREDARRRDGLDEVYERVDDAFYALDAAFRFTYVNERAERYLGRSQAELLGRNVWEVLSVEGEADIVEQFETAMERQEPTSFERYSATLGFWEAVRLYPSESGLSVYFRDVTERKERERDLERYEAIVEAMHDGVYVVDEDGRFTMVNEAYAEMIGLPHDAVEGAHVSTVVSEETVERASAIHEELADRAGGTDRLEAEMETADGETIVAEASFALVDTHRDAETRVGVVRDVTERNDRERELEEFRRRYQTLVEHFPSGGVAVVDASMEYVTFGGVPAGETGLTRTDVEGNSPRDVLPDAVADVVVPRYEAALDGEAAEFEVDLGDGTYQFQFTPVRDDDGAVFAAMGMSQDVTDRKEYERYLRDAKSQLEAAAEAGAIGTWEWHVRDDEMVTGPSFARRFGVDPVAARKGVSIDRFLSAVHEDDRERVQREIQDALESCGAYESEFRVRNADGDVRWVVARGQVECDEDGDPVAFPGAVTDITDRKRTERALARQREQLAALNTLNEVVQEITGAVIDQSTRENIERTVCEHLAATESYAFAWIGDVDVDSQTVRPRAEAGAEGYLDEITISVDPDDERSEGPTGRAIRTGEIQTARDIRDDSRHDPWRANVEAYGFRSSAAIPIVHRGTVYGVLNVYAERPYAFDGPERAVVSQLGEVVGHAIAGAEQQRALLSDEVAELEFRIRDVLGKLGVEADATGTVTLDHTIPLGGDEYLVYGTVDADGADLVEALVESLPHWTEASFGDGDRAGTFELRLSEPPVLSVLASLGGSVEEAVVADGDYEMTLHAPPGGEVRRLVDAVREAYPSAQLQKRRQITREELGPPVDANELLRSLTDRQRAAVEAAHHAGFFEWPREASGQDVSQSLGVSPPTFHQHLRKAERRLFRTLLSPGGTPDRE